MNLAPQLREAETDVQRTREPYERAREYRNKLIREALEAGWTHAQVAEATGLTRARIGHISKPQRKPGRP